MAAEIIDKEAVSRLRNITFRLAPRVRGAKVGVHRSLLRGISHNFLEYKEYSYGDELKHIDWRVYGRLDRFYVKKFEDEVNFTWFILLDKSNSMSYGSGDITKLDYAVRLSATLAYLLLRQGDSVGVVDFSSGQGNVVVPRAGMNHLEPILVGLSSVNPGGKTSFIEPVAQAAEKIKTDTAFILISDFFTDTDSLKEAMRLLSAVGKGIALLHVVDRNEIEFNFEGFIEFEDMEEEIKVPVDAKDIKETYIKRMNDFIETIKLMCLECGAYYIPSPLNLPTEEVLLNLAYKGT